MLQLLLFVALCLTPLLWKKLHFLFKWTIPQEMSGETTKQMRNSVTFQEIVSEFYSDPIRIVNTKQITNVGLEGTVWVIRYFRFTRCYKMNELQLKPNCLSALHEQIPNEMKTIAKFVWNLFKQCEWHLKQIRAANWAKSSERQ